MAYLKVNLPQIQDLDQIMQKISNRINPNRGLSAYAVYLKVYGPIVIDDLKSQINPVLPSATATAISTRKRNRPGLKVYSQKMREIWDNLSSEQKDLFIQASIKTGFVNRDQKISTISRRFNRLNI